MSIPETEQTNGKRLKWVTKPFEPVQLLVKSADQNQRPWIILALVWAVVTLVIILFAVRVIVLKELTDTFADGIVLSSGMVGVQEKSSICPRDGDPLVYAIGGALATNEQVSIKEDNIPIYSGSVKLRQAAIITRELRADLPNGNYVYQQSTMSGVILTVTVVDFTVDCSED